MQTKTFHIADYVIFGITIVISVAIGFFHAFIGGRQKTTSEFHLGNRKMAIFPVALSLLVTFESSIMMLGNPAETYVFGIQNVIMYFGWFVAHLLATKIIVPLIHPLKITSGYEYLELRFQSRAVRLLGTVLGMINYTMYMGIVLFGPAIALEGVIGFPQYASMVIVAVATLIYTSVGGFKAVIWTDVFQCCVMFAGTFAILIKGTMVAGGVESTWNIAGDHGRLNFFDFDTDITTRHTFWNLFFGGIFRGFLIVFNQSTIQRIRSTPTLNAARKVMLIVSPGFLITMILATYEGIVAYSFYHTLGCDPLKSKQITNPNQIIPHMVMEIFDGLPGMPGLFMASLFAASLSTLSSGLSSLSALFWEDIVKPHTQPMSELKATIISKVAVIVFGVVAIGVAFLVSIVGGTLTQITATILSSVGGPLTGLFLLGCFCPWANSKGAFVGTLSGIVLITWIAMGQYISPNVRKSVRLPPAPVDKCFLSDPYMYNVTAALLYNATVYIPDMANGMTTTVNIPNITAVLTANVIDRIPSGIDYFYSISYTWFILIGIFHVIIVGSIASFITGHTKPEDSNAMFLVSAVDELFFFLPKKVKTAFKFGYNYKKPKVYDTDDVIYNTTIDVDNPQMNSGKVKANLDCLKNERIGLITDLEQNAREKNSDYRFNDIYKRAENSRIPLLLFSNNKTEYK